MKKFQKKMCDHYLFSVFISILQPEFIESEF